MSSLFAAFAIVFLAELGDKTQLVALGFGARHRLVPVLAGVTLAYLATTTMSVAIGGVIGTALPTDVIGIGGGVLFLAFAAWTLRQGVEDSSADPEGTVGDSGPAGLRQQWRVGASVAVAMFVAELGDKTMLATATLAARGHPIPVWIGATLGILLAGMIGVVVGRVLGARLPERAVRIGSAALFAVFGVALIAVSI